MQNFEAARGDNFNLNLAIVDENGDPIDLTGYSFELILKPRKELADDDERVVSFNGEVSDASGGLATVAIDAEDSADLRGSYFYRVKMTDAEGGVHRAGEGVITFSDILVGAVTASMNVSIEDNIVTATIANFSGATTTFKTDKYSRTAASGFVTLTANQLAGSAVIPTSYAYRTDSLRLFCNGVLMEKGVQYSEAVDRTSFTLIGSYDDTDKFEANYVKN